MKKVTLSVAALALAMSSYGQCVTSSSDSVLISQESIQAGKSHENLRNIVYKAEDMLSMINQDIDSGYIYEQYAKFYQRLLKDIIKLTVELPKLHKDFESPEFREEIYKTTELERKKVC